MRKGKIWSHLAHALQKLLCSESTSPNLPHCPPPWDQKLINCPHLSSVGSSITLHPHSGDRHSTEVCERVLQIFRWLVHLVTLCSLPRKSKFWRSWHLTTQIQVYQMLYKLCLKHITQIYSWGQCLCGLLNPDGAFWKLLGPSDSRAYWVRFCLVLCFFFFYTCLPWIQCLPLIFRENIKHFLYW